MGNTNKNIGRNIDKGKALEVSGRPIPLETVVIGINGERRG